MEQLNISEMHIKAPEKKPDRNEIVEIANEVFLFKHQYPFEKRSKWAKEAFERYPEKIPMIVERHHKAHHLDDLSNPKFLMPRTFSIGEVALILRKKLNLTAEQSLVLLVNNGKDLVQ